MGEAGLGQVGQPTLSLLSRICDRSIHATACYSMLTELFLTSSHPLTTFLSPEVTSSVHQQAAVPTFSCQLAAVGRLDSTVAIRIPSWEGRSHCYMLL